MCCLSCLCRFTLRSATWLAFARHVGIEHLREVALLADHEISVIMTSRIAGLRFMINFERLGPALWAFFSMFHFFPLLHPQRYVSHKSRQPGDTGHSRCSLLRAAPGWRTWIYLPAIIARCAFSSRASYPFSCLPRAPKSSPDRQSSEHSLRRIARALAAVIGLLASTVVDRDVKSFVIVIFIS